MAHNYLPSADAELLAWSTNFIGLIETGFATYGLTSAQATAYRAAHDTYAGAYQAAYDPNTRTRPVIEGKAVAKRALATLARELVRIAQAFPEMTDELRRSLNITVPKARSPIPAPTARPVAEIVSVAAWTVTAYVHDTTSDRDKPEGVIGAKLYTFVGETYPSDPSEWEYQGDFTRRRCEITLPNTVAAGSRVWVCAAWYNRKGETGPASVPVSTNIQGGTMSNPLMKMAA